MHWSHAGFSCQQKYQPGLLDPFGCVGPLLTALPIRAVLVVIQWPNVLPHCLQPLAVAAATSLLMCWICLAYLLQVRFEGVFPLCVILGLVTVYIVSGISALPSPLPSPKSSEVGRRWTGLDTVGTDAPAGCPKDRSRLLSFSENPDP